MESVSEGGEGREGSEVKREGERRRGSARVSEGPRGSARVELSRHTFYINHERIFDIHRPVSPLFKGGGLDFAQDGKLDFLSKIQLSKKVGN